MQVPVSSCACICGVVRGGDGRIEGGEGLDANVFVYVATWTWARLLTERESGLARKWEGHRSPDPRLVEAVHCHGPV